MADIMKMGKNPNYLGSWDLEDLPGKEVTLTIARIVDEDVVADQRKECCTVCYWTNKDYKPMILNPTNKKTIVRLYHTKETTQLVGKTVVVGIEKVKAFGDVHDALRIKMRIPSTSSVKCADCGGDIQPAAGKGADYIVQGTQKTYGVALCWACACKRKEGTQTKTDEGEADGAEM